MIKKILFVAENLERTFVQDDIKILKKKYSVEVFKWNNILDTPKLFIAIKRNDLIYMWFEYYYAGITTFLSKILNRKTILVAAGAITLNYGWEKRNKKFLVKLITYPLTKYAAKYATHIFAVSEYKKKGILNHIKKRPICVVPNGINVDFYKPSGKKEDIISTTCFINDTNIKVKGLITFIKAAKHFPKLKFIVIGNGPKENIDDLKKIASSNVSFVEPKNQKDIRKYLQKSKYYAQLSLFESFGCALAEAMLCNCIPIVTDTCSLPEVAGKIGIYVKPRNLSSTIEGIKKALKSKNSSQREHILKEYSLKNRENLIFENLKKI